MTSTNGNTTTNDHLVLSDTFVSMYSPFILHFSKMLMQCRSVQSILSFTRSMQKTSKKKLQSSEIQMIKKIQDDQVSQCIVF